MDTFKVKFRVEGMTCSNCSLGIKKHLEKKGFVDVFVDFSDSQVGFTCYSEKDIEKGVKEIESIGYRVISKYGDSKNFFLSKISIETKFIISLVLTIPLLMSMFVKYELFHNALFQLFLTLPVYLIGAQHFGIKGFKSLKTGIANMDVLVIMGASAAFIYSLIGTIKGLGPNYMFYETTASIITIILLGNLIEQRSVKKTTSAIDELLNLQPEKAKRITNNMNESIEVIEEVNLDQIAVGDKLLVNTGDKIPVDGEVFWGNAFVDESLISGESTPVFKKKGEKVIAGSILTQNSIKISTTAVGNNTVLSQIIELVKNAQQQKPKLQNLADKISSIFVPLVIVIAILTFSISYFVIDIALKNALMRGIAVLVIACPCALGLAIPTAVVVGVGKMARKGILIKGGITIDIFANIKNMVFDKTGTLTTGRFSIKSIKTFDIDEMEIKSILLGLEKYASHPIATSIVKIFSEEKITPYIFEKAEQVKGVGVRGWDSKNIKYEIGSQNLLKDTEFEEKISQRSICLLIDGVLKAIIEITDEIKPEAKQLIDFLKKHNIKPIMLSGDNKNNCMDVAKVLEIEEVYYEMRPHEKLAIIEKLNKKGKTAMVGDGINDAPALAKATLGISLSNATQVAVRSSQIILLNGNLGLLIPALILSKKTLLTIKQNLFWAFFYNVAAIPFAAAGYLSPMIAALAMAFSDLIVVGNSLKLKYNIRNK